MIWTSSAIGAVLTLRAVEPARFLFWRDFSKLWTMIGVLGTWAALALVAYLGIAVSRAALGPEAWLGTDLAAGLVAQTSARRMRSTERGGTLVLGVLPDLFRWVDAFVRQHVLNWAHGLDDEALVAAAARLDNRPAENAWNWHMPTVGEAAPDGSLRGNAGAVCPDTAAGETGCAQDDAPTRRNAYL